VKGGFTTFLASWRDYEEVSLSSWSHYAAAEEGLNSELEVVNELREVSSRSCNLCGKNLLRHDPVECAVHSSRQAVDLTSVKGHRMKQTSYSLTRLAKGFAVLEDMLTSQNQPSCCKIK
jgi:hypothetical protein